MAELHKPGPMLTYVTDPELSMVEQRRVLRSLVRCAPEQKLRIGFRLPESSDAEVAALIDWYHDTLRDEGMSEEILPALIHNRPNLASRYPEAHVWLPARKLIQGETADVFSVHSVDEVELALGLGANEVIFGHVFETHSHEGVPGRGVEALSQVQCAARTVNRTAMVTAIGGINEHNVADIARAGVSGIAVIRAIGQSENILNTLRAIRNGWIAGALSNEKELKGTTQMTSNDKKTTNDYGALSCTTLSITMYLKQRKIDPKTVAIAINDEVIPRDLWDEYNIRDEDKVEVVRAVSGGDHDSLTIADHTFGSRLFVGTGKYPDNDSMIRSLDSSGTEMVTVAIRIMNLDGDEPSILESIDLSRYKLLPNTAGAYTVKDAVKMARLAREATGTNWIKLEVIGDQRSLWPDVSGTIEATKILVDDGFVVLPYTSPDLVAALRLEEAGAATVMPLAAPIGSGQGMQDWRSIERIIDAVSVPVVVDAGIGVPSDAALAMELGASAVLVNTAIAKASDPAAMAHAMKLGVEAGRISRLAGRMQKTAYANPSSPVGGVPLAIE